MRRVRRFIVAIAVVSVMCAGSKSVRAGGQVLQWDDTGHFKVFGANEFIVIDFGTIDFVGDCAVDGVDDGFFPAATVYIVPAGAISNGAALRDDTGSALWTRFLQAADRARVVVVWSAGKDVFVAGENAGVFSGHVYTEGLAPR